LRIGGEQVWCVDDAAVERETAIGDETVEAGFGLAGLGIAGGGGAWVNVGVAQGVDVARAGFEVAGFFLGADLFQFSRVLAEKCGAAELLIAKVVQDRNAVLCGDVDMGDALEMGEIGGRAGDGRAW